MIVLRKITEYAVKEGVEFIVIGGHAVSAHGFQRTTADLDLAVKESQREQWLKILAAMRYKMFHEHGSFVQFEPDDIGAWPVDLVFVSDDTFEGLKKDAKEFQFRECKAFVPSTKHLIAMKLHALKQNPNDRYQDLADIKELLLIMKLDVKAEEFKNLCLKYGSEELYETIIKNR